MLCWHVDYWDRLGWEDPFGDPAYTQRQRAYREARKPKQFGTPQFVIEGDFLPWEKGMYESIPTKVAGGSKAAAKLRIEAKAAASGGKVSVDVKLAKLDAKLALSKTTHVLPVLVQRKATTKVPKGENAGKTLSEWLVVRKAAKPVAAATALEKKQTVSLTLPKGLKPADVGVALIVEDPATMRPIESVFVPVATGTAAPKKPAK